MTHTLSIAAGHQTLTIRSDTPTVTDWAHRYFGPYWPATPGADTSGPLLTATDRADPNALRALALAEHADEAVFARDRIGYTRHQDGTVTALTLSDPALHYRYSPADRHLEITSASPLAPTATLGQPTRLATATTRFARQMMSSQLAADGWVLLHASAAVLDDGTALLALGDSGAGKTTTALTLAAVGWSLLANDCCFARPSPTGELDLLPWPAAAAVGLGLMDALAWTAVAGTRIGTGERPHPTQHHQVTQALTTAHATPVRARTGRELKAHIWPEQLIDWFHLKLATSAVATVVVLPRVLPSASPTINRERSSEITRTVFNTSDGPERYPDLFGLTDGSSAGRPEARSAVIAHLNTLPRFAVDLGHDHVTNTDFLTALARSNAALPDGAIPADPAAERERRLR